MSQNILLHHCITKPNHRFEGALNVKVSYLSVHLLLVVLGVDSDWLFGGESELSSVSPGAHVSAVGDDQARLHGLGGNYVDLESHASGHRELGGGSECIGGGPGESGHVVEVGHWSVVLNRASYSACRNRKCFMQLKT